MPNLDEKRVLEITVAALTDYKEKRYRVYKSNNSLPVTDEEFEKLKENATEIREITEVLDDFESKLGEIIENETDTTQKE